jgi:Family of unknown function (DUF6541)
MHATEAPAVGIGGVVPRSLERRALLPFAVALPYLGAAAGTCVLIRSFRTAAEGDVGLKPFHLFWIGMLLFLVPATYRLLGFVASRGERIALVAATGAFLFIPKVLRAPDGPVYFDELAHWRQTESISQSGRLFEPNSIVHFAQFFPGLDSVDLALQRMTGLSTFAAGTAMLAMAHVVALLGVFRLGERVLGSPRLGALAALVYGLNTSFVFFDSQYSYESLAIVFFIWGLACTAEALAVPPGAARLGWVAAALVSAVACVVTHHLSSYALIFALAFLTVATLICRRGRPVRRRLSAIAGITLTVAICAFVWSAVVAPDIVSYFAPAIQHGVEQVTGLAQGSKSGSRQLFVRSTTPSYERTAAYLSPVIAFVLAASGLWALRRRLLIDPVVLGLAAFGVLFFVSLPFILTQGGAEGARRSWAFTSLGLCLLVAAGLAAAAGLPRRLDLSVARVAIATILTAGVAIIAVGNTASGLNADYRFPGPFAYGSDARTVTAETHSAVDWMQTTAGTHQRTIADRDTGLAFGTLGSQWIERAWEGMPLWEFFMNVRQPDAAMLDRLRKAAPRYLIIDARMAESLPKTGVYLAPEEPGARRHTKPVPIAALDKYARVPWAIQVYASDHYRIYRLDLGLLDTCADLSRTAYGGPDCRKAP